MDLIRFKEQIKTELRTLTQDPEYCIDLNQAGVRLRIMPLRNCYFEPDTVAAMKLPNLTTIDQWVESFKLECPFLHDVDTLMAVLITYGAVSGYLGNELKASSAFEADVYSSIIASADGDRLTISFSAVLHGVRKEAIVVFTFTKPQLH